MPGAREWLIPLGLGLATFAGLMLLPERAHDDPEAGASTLLHPFEGGAIVVDGTARMLVVDRAEAHAVGTEPASNGTHDGLDALPSITWRTPHVGVYASQPLPVGCDCVGPVFHLRVQADRHVRFGVDGHNATSLTVHVFDGDGRLVASNAPAGEQERLGGSSVPEQLPAGVWYLGDNATAPAGTKAPPLVARPLLPQLRSLLHGQPEGGVVTLETDAAQSLFGRVYITARLGDVVHAP